MASKQRSQPLPSKEDGLLKQVMKAYDQKQYKKGMKAADAILKKFPAHGETLAFKALILSSQHPDRKTEALDLAKSAIKADMKAYLCWHVYGLLHRNDGNYEMAEKCYLSAIKLDPENGNMVRDLAYIQMQLRNMSGLVPTAQKLLSIKSNVKTHWLMLAVAHHLAGNHLTATQVLNSYLSTIDTHSAKDMDAQERIELSEIELYVARIHFEAGSLDEALGVLTARTHRICDRVGRYELEAEIRQKRGELDEAQALYRKLIAIIPDNYEYHQGLCTALQLPAGSETPSDEVLARLKAVYSELHAQHPDCSTMKRIELDFLQGDEFTAAAEERFRLFVARGVPSLFSHLKPLAQQPGKDALLWGVAERMLADVGEGTIEAAWLRLYLAQHAALHRRWRTAVEHICAAEACDGLGAAAVDVFSAKADILEAVGDARGAAAAAEVARLLDGKDRYVNSMAAKFWFRAGDIERAEKTALLFALDFDGRASNLTEMQVIWYELERGCAFQRAGNLGMAFKMFSAVLAHFDEYQEDQYDFHGYCTRKATLRAYVDMLRMQDSLLGHSDYGTAAGAMIQGYLQLHAEDRHGAAQRKLEKSLEGLSDAARQKALDKRARDADKARKAKAAKIEKARLLHNSRRNAGKFDPDPQGEEFLETKAPLEEAEKLVRVLRKHAGGRLGTHTAAFAVAKLKDKPFLAVHAVKHALHLDRDAPGAHCALVELVHWLSARPTGHANADAAAVLQDEAQQLAGGKSAAEVNEAYAQRCGSAALPAQLAVARCQLLLRPDEPAAAAERLTSCDLASISNTAAEAAEAHAWLQQHAPDAAPAFFAAAQQVHRWSTVFDGPERLPLPADDGLSERLQSLALVPAPAMNGAAPAAVA